MSRLISESAQQRLIEWLLSSDDTGVSSESMAAVALGVTKARRFGYDAPYDPGDFGRCYRLVKAVPELVEVFPAISKAVPIFAGILANWTELCALYERERPTGKCEELYNRIQQLRKESKA